MSENIIEKNAVEQYEHDYVVYAKEANRRRTSASEKCC